MPVHKKMPPVTMYAFRNKYFSSPLPCFIVNVIRRALDGYSITNLLFYPFIADNFKINSVPDFLSLSISCCHYLSPHTLNMERCCFIIYFIILILSCSSCQTQKHTKQLQILLATAVTHTKNFFRVLIQEKVLNIHVLRKIMMKGGQLLSKRLTGN